jgi:hypothetical protein
VLGETVAVERSVTRDSRGITAGEVANTWTQLWLLQILPCFLDSIVGCWWQKPTIHVVVGLGDDQRHALDPILRLGGACGKLVGSNLAYAGRFVLLGGIAAARHDLLCVGRGCFVARARGFLMTDSTCATNPTGRGAPVSTWMRYRATFLRASSVLAVRVGKTGRDRGGMLAGWVAGDSSRCRRWRFSHVSGGEGSESARLRLGVDYNMFTGDTAISFIRACGGGRGRGVDVRP